MCDICTQTAGTIQEKVCKSDYLDKISIHVPYWLGQSQTQKVFEHQRNLHEKWKCCKFKHHERCVVDVAFTACENIFLFHIQRLLKSWIIETIIILTKSNFIMTSTFGWNLNRIRCGYDT